jgi:hypothetical protein
MRDSSVIFKKRPKVSSHPLIENSPNLVTLIAELNNNNRLN